MYLRCPHCSNAFELIADLDTDDITCPSCHTKLSVDSMLSEGPVDPDEVTASALEVMPKRGDMIAHFRLETEIGQGGFGSVFRAWDTRLERAVAVKLPRMKRMSRRQAELFVREAQAAAQLCDPNIVPVYEVGRDGDRVYIVSKLIEGVTLVDWIKQCPRSFREIAQVIAKVASAMQRAHDRGVIHRDLKPRNVMMDENDEPHVTDFGLAKRDDPTLITVTVRGDVIGTPAYMPPEQAEGNAHGVDRRGDVYSMGVMLYELIAGKRPFRGESDLLINEVIECRPRSPRAFNPSIPPVLEAICLRAMARDPEQRFATASEFANDLLRFASGKPTLTRPPSAIQHAWYQLTEHRVAATIAALSLALVSSIILYFSRPATAAPKYTLQTDFQVLPVDATVKIERVDPFVQPGIAEPKPISAQLEKQGGNYSIQLEPGYYLVTLEHPIYGKHTIARKVPATSQDSRVRSNPGSFDAPTPGPMIKYEHLWWEPIAERHISWSGFEMTKVHTNNKQFFLEDQELVEVAGGELNFASNTMFKAPGQLAIQPTLTRVPSFYIGRREVSIRSFERVMGFVPAHAQRLLADETIDYDSPVVGATFDEALVFCQRIGARLPTVKELLFTKLWLDSTQSPSVVNADEQPAGNQQPAVEGLVNQTLEWTMDLFMPIREIAPEQGIAPQLSDGLRCERSVNYRDLLFRSSRRMWSMVQRC